jgi:uncharacterized protein (TIGR03067 family)
MIHLCKLAVLATALLAVDAPEEQAVKKEFQQLHGTWVVTDAEQNGQPLDRIKGGTLAIQDQNFVIKTKSGAELKGDLRIDPARKPKTMDFSHNEGALRDKTWEAIYALDGDDLKICYAKADSNQDRPKEFKTQADSGLLLVVLKRQKK